MRVQVCWICSLPRSGSSVTAYAAAAPWGHAVADEVLSPWDRTGPPYGYPPLQRELVRAYHAARCRLTREIVEIADELFDILGQRTGRVVFKHPHMQPHPEEVRQWFPTHRRVFIVRNPIRRLNSLYARGWTDALRPGHEVHHFKCFLRNWRNEPHVVFERMRSDPHAYFRAIYQAWGWQASEADVERAVRYARDHYHGNSRQTDEDARERPVSEETWALPEEALMAYLDDEEIVAFLREQGWPTDPDAYRLSPTGTGKRRLLRPARPVLMPAPEPQHPTPASEPEPIRPSHARILAIVSLPQSGEELVARAAAGAIEAALLLEPFGPWLWCDGVAHAGLQRTLVDALENERGMISQAVVDATDRLLAAHQRSVVATLRLGSVDLHEFRDRFPESRVIAMIRHPIERLADVAARGWWQALGVDDGLREFKAMKAAWAVSERRITFTEFERDPDAAFTRLFESWEVEITPDQVRAASKALCRLRGRDDAGASDPLADARGSTRRDLRLELQRASKSLAEDYEVRRFAERMGWNLVSPLREAGIAHRSPGPASERPPLRIATPVRP
jgi:hypothetical protein